MTFMKGDDGFKIYTCSGDTTLPASRYQNSICNVSSICRECKIQRLIGRLNNLDDTAITLPLGMFLLLKEDI